MKQIRLSERLLAVASFVESGTNVVDVGTDHGYIPRLSRSTGEGGRIIAADVRKGPLERARRSAHEYDVSDRIDFILSDGLAFTDGRDVDTIIFAGMGGETITGILKNASWTKDGRRLILQPQSKIDMLSEWLRKTDLPADDGMLVTRRRQDLCHHGCRGVDTVRTLSPAEALVSRIYLEKRDPLLPAYLDILIQKTARAVGGIAKSRKQRSMFGACTSAIGPVRTAANEKGDGTMVKVSDVAGYLEELAPPAQKCDWDNVGLLVGRGENRIERILVSLDITDAVIEEAVRDKAGVIVSHHPLFFSLKRVTDNDAAGCKIIKLIKNNISAICMHTNLDAAEGGVNDALAKAVGLHDTDLLSVDGIGEDGKPYGIGLFGRLETPATAV